MAYTLKGFSHFPYFLAKGLISDLSDQVNTVIKGALMKDAYTPNQDSDEDWADVSTHDVHADATLDPEGDYPAGGIQLPGLAAGASVSIVGRVVTVDFDDASMDDVTFGGYKLVIYDDTPAAAADKKLIAYSIFGGLKASNDGTYRIVLNTAGLFSQTTPA